MTWEESLEIVVAQTGHERYRELCAETWPDHQAYRALMLELATGEAPSRSPDAEDAALQAYVARHGCGNC